MRSARQEGANAFQSLAVAGATGNSAGKPRSAARRMPMSEAAYPIVSGILDLVPASRWAFARIGPHGDLALVFESHRDGKTHRALTDELKRQRQEVPTGPRIAATLGQFGDCTSGVTLIFADTRETFGILTLLRTPDFGSLTSSEITVLTLALHAASDRLAELRLQTPTPITAKPKHQPTGSPSEPPDGAFYVLDADLQIVLAWSSEDQRRVASTGLHSRIAERLPLVLEESVRQLTAGWSSVSENEPGIGHPVPFLVIQTQPMSGPAGFFVGVRVERYRPPNSLTAAVARFHITPREVQVLKLMLDGQHLDAIAKQLFITSSTVQDHIRNMLDKTESSNRSELIARVLGWNAAPSHERNRPSRSSAVTPR